MHTYTNVWACVYIHILTHAHTGTCMWVCTHNACVCTHRHTHTVKAQKKIKHFFVWNSINFHVLIFISYVFIYCICGNHDFVTFEAFQQYYEKILAIPLWGMYPKDDQSYHKDMCSTMFITALFAISRTRKQPPRCPSIEEWIKKMWYIYTM